MGRKSNYSASLYSQYEEVLARLSQMESAMKKDREELRVLNHNIQIQAADISKLTDTVGEQEHMIRGLRSENEALREENQILRDDNERMKRILNNNSRNSSLPPSSDPPCSGPSAEEPPENGSGKEEEACACGRPVSQYNGRSRTGRKKGGQPGHKGTTLTKESVEEKIQSGVFQHKIKHIGRRSDDYVVRYVLDLDVRVTATEVRIYADKNGKYPVPGEYHSEVTYGPNTKAAIACLYSEGVMSNDRICGFINSLSGDALSVSEGAVYGICRQFSKLCGGENRRIEDGLLNGHVLCTDATYMTQNGKRAYIRNFSNDSSVLYVAAGSKKLEELKKMEILNRFTGILEHDHETALYHFGTGHAECNVHLERYLRKNTEETGNTWSHDMAMFLKGMNHARKEQQEKGRTCFRPQELARYESRYDAILESGEKQFLTTRGKYARKEERKLLNRLKKYKASHLLFLHDFEVPYSDNMSERDLRKCKNRQKMAGGFRSKDGMEMYCSIMSVIETVKRRGKNVFHSIVSLFEGSPVIT